VRDDPFWVIEPAGVLAVEAVRRVGVAVAAFRRLAVDRIFADEG